jgi:serine/threonine-protein kinase
MVDVLARNLDGAGPLHTISPTVVAREWTGRADRETVRAFARRHGAGSAVYGQLLRAGADSVRASVTLLDVRTGEPLAELRRQEARSHMDHLTDSLTVDVLRALGGAVAVGAARVAYLGRVRSIEALRAFLDGEQFYRRAVWDSAVGHYQRAVALDSAFALAWRRLGLVASWQRLQQDSLTAVYLLRAGAANRGLGPRDSLLVAADSLSAAASTTPNAVEAFGLTRRLFATLDEAARRYPSDPEVWFALGEARYHLAFGPVVGIAERATLDALDRAIALDSSFAPAYIHAVELGFNIGGAPLGLRYARPYLALNPTEPAHRGALLIEPLVDPRRARGPEVDALLDTARASALVSARTILRRWPDDAETAVRLSRLLAEGRPSEYPLFADTAFMRRRLAEQLAYRGHVAEAYRVLGVRDLPIFAELAHLGAVPPSVAQPTLLRWARDGSGPARLALPYWSAQRDTAALTLFLSDVPARARRSGASEVEARARMRYDSASAFAHLALARGDSVGALGQFVALPDTLCPECYLDRLTRARVLRAAGRAAEALTTLDEALVAFLTPIEVLFAVERARAARQAGNHQLAGAACRSVRAAWSRADPLLRATASAACGALP